MVIIRGTFVGGCDDTKALYRSGELEQKHLVGLVQHKRTTGTERIETAKLIPMDRSKAMNPPFWYPNTVNNNVVRLTGLQVSLMAALSAGFHWEMWARYMAIGLLVDFAIRVTAGSGVSPLGMVATFLTSPLKPDFKPGPPKQFAAFCGVFFSTMATIFYFLDFEYHDVVGACFMGGEFFILLCVVRNSPSMPSPTPAFVLSGDRSRFRRRVGSSLGLLFWVSLLQFRNSVWSHS